MFFYSAEHLENLTVYSKFESPYCSLFYLIEKLEKLLDSGVAQKLETAEKIWWPTYRIDQALGSKKMEQVVSK